MAQILVVEDDADVRGLIITMLESAGHRVTHASNGIEGIKKYKSENIDLIITDIMMPEKDGI